MRQVDVWLTLEKLPWGMLAYLLCDTARRSQAPLAARSTNTALARARCSLTCLYITSIFGNRPAEPDFYFSQNVMPIGASLSEQAAPGS